MTGTHTAADYALRFDEARKLPSPEVDAFERAAGYAIDLERLEAVARVLACPVKVNLPSWQHGRVIYAATRRYLRASGLDAAQCLDIGTAKGFSALCLLWAVMDAGVAPSIDSVDVIDPNERTSRNTVAEVDGAKTLYEILEPWPEHDAIRFWKMTGRQWLTRNTGRVHVAFVDGKHSYEEVSWEAALLAQRQRPGDVVIFDDLQIPKVAQAVREVRGYAFELVQSAGGRTYAVAVKEGRC